MQPQNQEIYIIIIIGCLIAFLLVGFIVTTLFLYQRRQKKQEEEVRRLKEAFEKESAKSQIEIQENTMAHIAEELHHGIKNDLAGIAWYLNVLGMEQQNKEITETAASLNKITEEIREMAHSLHTGRIAKVGLIEALETEVKKLLRRKDITTAFDCTVHQNFFDAQTTVFIYRMVQELTQNILKHAKASVITIKVFVAPEDIFTIQIQDNGKGFNVEEAKRSKTAGVGLQSIINRTAMIGGKIIFESEISKGTTVWLEIPIPHEQITIKHV